MGLCYGIGGCALSALRHHGAAAPISLEPLWQNIRMYMRALRSHRVMQSLMISTAASEILGFSHQVLLSAIADNVLHVGAAGLGVLTTFRFVGGMLRVVLLTILGPVQRQGRLLLVVLALFGVGQILLGHLEVGYLAGLTSASVALVSHGLALMALPLVLLLVLPELRRL